MGDDLEDRRWAAVVARDEAAAELFRYGVVTTGVYCRPGCPARRPYRSNVRFFDTSEEAESAGLRACLRCDPAGPGPRARRAALAARVCRIIEEADVAPGLAALAAEVAISPFHLQRVFKAETGLSPKGYADAVRAQRLRLALGSHARVTDAAYDAGFASSGRFYAASADRLGMTPTEFRDGAPGVPVRFAVGDSELGAVLVAATERGVCAIELGDDADDLVRRFQARFHAARLVGDDPELGQLVERVVALVEAPGNGDRLPLDVRGTAFQERVWRALRDVAPGTTVTYGELAERAGAPGSARAVAAACAANRLAVAIPCHRVVRADGSLSGYRWGVERKRALLERERADRGPAAGA